MQEYCWGNIPMQDMMKNLQVKSVSVPTNFHLIFNIFSWTKEHNRWKNPFNPWILWPTFQNESR